MLPKVSVINRSINSLVGRKFHKGGVCACVRACVRVIREMEKGRGRKENERSHALV